MKIIYDFGSNNGDDIPYYLLNAEKVVAVEANPILCEIISSRFSKEIQEGRVIVENCAITGLFIGFINFYIHEKNDVLSSLIPPIPCDQANWKMCRVRAIPVCQIIEKYGTPFYIKIDIEGLDHEILDSLAENNIKPEFISAESHKIEVLTILSERLGYNKFKLVEGRTLSKNYRNRFIYSSINQCILRYSFPHHSAGPFGEDIDGFWLSKESFEDFLYARGGLGWRDIHATTQANTLASNYSQLLCLILNIPARIFLQITHLCFRIRVKFMSM